VILPDEGLPGKKEEGVRHATYTHPQEDVQLNGKKKGKFMGRLGQNLIRGKKEKYYLALTHRIREWKRTG